MGAECAGLFIWQVGFTVGQVPDSVRFSTVYATLSDSSQAVRQWNMDMDWTPCLADVGNVTMCFEAVNMIRTVNGTRATLPDPTVADPTKAQPVPR